MAVNKNYVLAPELKGAGFAVLPILDKWEDPSDAKPFTFPWGGKDNPRELSYEEIDDLFKKAFGTAVICGSVSSGLYMLDFDVKEEGSETFFQEFQDTVQDAGFSLDGCYIESTVNGGKHVFFRFPAGATVPPNQKLARTEGGYVAVESRGQGGIAYVWPTPGYEQEQGTLVELEPLPEATAEALVAIAKSLDRAVPEASSVTYSESRTTHSERPGDRFNQEKTWEQILEPHGHKKLFTRGGLTYWCRSGKKHGVSMTTGLGRSGQDLLKVFSSNAHPLSSEDNKSYDKFGAWVELEHGGDFAKATRAAAKEFGMESAPDAKVITIQRSEFALQKFDYHQTDLGNAQMLVRAMRGEFRYCHGMRGWLVWDGKRFVLDESGQMARARFIEMVQSLYAIAADWEDADERKKLVTWAMKCESKRFIDAAVSIAMALPDISVRIEDLDTDRWLLNVQNGVIDLRTGALLPHSPERLITKICPVEYDPDAPVSWENCPAFESLVKHAFGDDPDTGQWLLTFAGYSLTGQIKEQCFAFLHGPAKAGKSTFVETVKGILGEYAVLLPTDSLMKKYGAGGIPSEFATLNKARMVVCEETEDSQYFASSLLKHLSGTEELRTRYMYKEWFDLQITFKLWIVGNDRPQVSNFDDALHRRMNVVPFEKPFSEDQRDKDIKEKLIEEYPAILRILVNYCLNWQKDGLQKSEAMLNTLNDYQAEMDKVGRFLEDYTTEDNHMVINATRVYKAFKKWCDDNGHNCESQTRFGMKMKKKGYPSENGYADGKKAKVYKGFDLTGGEDY